MAGAGEIVAAIVFLEKAIASPELTVALTLPLKVTVVDPIELTV